MVVLEWIFTRSEDLYRGMRREPSVPNLWWGAVPGTVDEAGRVVVCAHWMDEIHKVVRCDSLAVLQRPL